LSKHRGLRRFQGQDLRAFDTALYVDETLRAGRECCAARSAAANQMGDVTYAAYCCDQLNTNFLAAVTPLSEAQGEAELGLAFAQEERFGLVIDASPPSSADPNAARLTPTFVL